MNEYIKRKDAEDYIKNFGKGAISDGLKTLDPVDDIVLLARGVDMIPAADVVEVVRCKDCKYLYCFTAVDGLFYCQHVHGMKGGLNPIEESLYCCYGEKKEGAKE